MKFELVQFLCNSPVEVSLLTLSPTPKEGTSGLKYFYPLSDGHGMWADAELHRKIQLFEFNGQPFFICKRRAHGKRRLWDLWRGSVVGANEQAVEPKDGRLVLELARSLDRIEPKPAPQPIPIRSEAPQPLATGTYGPVAVATAPVKNAGRIPLNVAVREIIAFTTDALKQTGQQWSENSVQDLVSTVVISATKAGYTTLWER
jgi:hypothetical protein